MAAQLKLILLEEAQVAIDDLDLLDGADGFALANDGWIMKTPENLSDLFATLQEAMTLRVLAQDHDDLALILQTLTDKKQQAEWYWSEYVKHGVWLRVQLDGETIPRQALVKTIRHAPSRDLYAPEVRYKNKILEYLLGIERVGFWEAPGTTGYQFTTQFQPIGGIIDYVNYGSANPGAIVGDVPARIMDLRIIPADDTPIYQMWVGFRTDRLGTLAYFQSNWALRRASSFGADTTGGTSNPDVTALALYRTVTTFATTPTLARRVTIRVSDVTTHAADQRGEYQVLLRARLSATGVVRVRLSDGLYNQSVFSTRPRVVIDKTSWFIYDLGTIKIPNSGRMLETSFLFTEMALGIDAERVSGTPQLYMDGLILSPIGEGSVYFEQEGPDLGVATSILYIQQRADGKVYGAFSALATASWPRVTINGGVPVGNGIAVITGQAKLESSVDHRIDQFLMTYIPRWETLRGDEVL